MVGEKTHKLITTGTFVDPKFRKLRMATILTREIANYAGYHGLTVIRSNQSDKMLKAAKRVGRETEHKVVPNLLAPQDVGIISFGKLPPEKRPEWLGRGKRLQRRKFRLPKWIGKLKKLIGRVRRK